MKVAKIKTKIEKPTEQKNEYSVKQMLKIVIILLVVFLFFYLITSFLVKESYEEKVTTPAVIDSTNITLGQLLNRKEKEYYVIATKASLYKSSYIQTNYITLYNNYINEYKQEENSIKFYYVDLDNALNKNYFGDELNISENISELKLNDEVLFKITDGKIEKTYVGKQNILEKLSKL